MSEDTIKQFSKTSKNYSKDILFSHGKDLDMIIKFVKPKKFMNMLDIATGAAHVAIKLSQYVKCVEAIDITPKMIQEAEKNIKSQNITNIKTKVMEAD